MSPGTTATDPTGHDRARPEARPPVQQRPRRHPPRQSRGHPALQGRLGTAAPAAPAPARLQQRPAGGRSAPVRGRRHAARARLPHRRRRHADLQLPHRAVPRGFLPVPGRGLGPRPDRGRGRRLSRRAPPAARVPAPVQVELVSRARHAAAARRAAPAPGRGGPGREHRLFQPARSRPPAAARHQGRGPPVAVRAPAHRTRRDPRGRRHGQ